jgi:hypothetical protein
LAQTSKHFNWIRYKVLILYKNMTSNIDKCIYWLVIYCIAGAYCCSLSSVSWKSLGKKEKANIVKWFTIP